MNFAYDLEYGSTAHGYLFTESANKRPPDFTNQGLEEAGVRRENILPLPKRRVFSL